MAVDLHVHTTASDGEFSPREVVELAKAIQLEAIALTDHDTVDGLEEGLYWGKKHDLQIIPGCEICASYKEKWLHILGYFIDYHNEHIRSLCSKIDMEWRNNVDTQIANLRQAGFYLEKDRVVEDGPRPMYVSYGTAIFEDSRNNHNQLINKYRAEENPIVRFCMDWIVPGRPFNSPQNIIPAEIVIDTILKSGGVPILAHPGMTLSVDDDPLIDDLLRFGIVGLEVFTGWHGESEEEHYSRFCRERGILVTCGSDFHGKLKPHIKLGQVKNNTYEVVEQLKAKKAFLHNH